MKAPQLRNHEQVFEGRKRALVKCDSALYMRFRCNSPAPGLHGASRRPERYRVSREGTPGFVKCDSKSSIGSSRIAPIYNIYLRFSKSAQML